jgi:hypothetical protein
MTMRPRLTSGAFVVLRGFVVLSVNVIVLL